jgi:hypothetical protein
MTKLLDSSPRILDTACARMRRVALADGACERKPGETRQEGTVTGGMNQRAEGPGRATRTSTFSIPLPPSLGRGGFVPELALSYDSGSDNGPFGFGSSIALPAIVRKTHNGLPRYEHGTDTFLISGADDLVPEIEKDGGGDWVALNGKQSLGKGGGLNV